MKEAIETVVSRRNPQIDPHLSIWGWEIPVYLFLGGLVAGLLVLSGIFYLLKKDEDMPFTVFRAPLWAPPLLAIGMFALFLDLEYKLHVFRFYTTFQWTSPMSWGSWILIIVFPVSIVFGLQQLRDEDRRWFRDKTAKLPRLPGLLDRIFGLADGLKRWQRPLAITNVVVGIFLGIYTGILLSALAARPFWNTSLLGFLFLTSGLSAASAFGLLFAHHRSEERTLMKLDLGFLVLELVILSQIIIGWYSSTLQAWRAGGLILGGAFTAAFWSLVVAGGICIPIFLESLELRRKIHLRYATPVIVLVGGLMLRVFFVYIGQYSGI